MTPSERKRTRIFVDPKVQGALALRVVLYWIVCILAVAVMLFCWELLTAPVRELSTRLNDMWFYYGPALVASFLLLPLVVIDIIRISHRFAGPLVRMRAATALKSWANSSQKSSSRKLIGATRRSVSARTTSGWNSPRISTRSPRDFSGISPRREDRRNRATKPNRLHGTPVAQGSRRPSIDAGRERVSFPLTRVSLAVRAPGTWNLLTRPL
jgi:hypothetical protein